jgi:hypothetical protein
MRPILTTILLVLLALSAAAQNYNAAEREYIAAQKEMLKAHPGFTCTWIPPWTLITNGRLNRRVDIYKEKMGKCQLPCVEDITYSIDDAIVLLEKLSADGYDGFRVYFGIDPSIQTNTPLGKDTKWALIFVPTTDGGWYHRWEWDQNRIHNDILKNSLIINDKGVQPITSATASIWINKAYYYIDSLERTRKKNCHKFHETHNLWYNNKYVRDNCIHNGLLEILKCKKALGTKHVYAKFAAFGWSLYLNQLTLVFQVDDGDKKAFLSLNSLDLSEKGFIGFKKCFGKKKGVPLADGSGGSDTGHPCPPPTPCNGTTAGALLPNP